MTKRAAVYSRVSTADQVDGTSLDEQLRVCLSTIGARGWVDAGHYTDEGISGADGTRPAWKRMLADAQAGKLDAVVVAKLDRFGRTTRHVLEEFENLKTCGVALVSVKENLDLSTAHGEMMLTMLAGFAQLERATILDRTVGGQRAKARSGAWPGGKPPYGWKLEGTKRDARPVPDLDERRTLGFMLRWLVKERKTAGQVADLLNASDIPSRTGIRWSPSVVRRMMQNPALHDGIYRWGQSAHGTTNGRSHKTRLDPRTGLPIGGAQVDVQLPDPPLTRAEFNAAGRAMKRNRDHAPAAAMVTRMLTGRLFGECGKHYTGTSIAGKDYDVHRCTGRRHLGKERAAERCSCSQVNEAKLNARVWGEVCKLLGDPQRLDAMARQWLELSETDDPEADRQVSDGVRSRLARLERAIERGAETDLMADDEDRARTSAVVGKLKAERKELRVKLAEHEARQADAKLRGQRLSDLAALAQRATGRLQAMAEAQRREVIQLLDIRVHMARIVDSEPQELEVRGQIDPRLFDANTDGQEPWLLSRYTRASAMIAGRHRRSRASDQRR